jgi:hypothetical protein
MRSYRRSLSTEVTSRPIARGTSKIRFTSLVSVKSTRSRDDNDCLIQRCHTHAVPAADGDATTLKTKRRKMRRRRRTLGIAGTRTNKGVRAKNPGLCRGWRAAANSRNYRDWRGQDSNLRPRGYEVDRPTLVTSLFDDTCKFIPPLRACKFSYSLAWIIKCCKISRSQRRTLKVGAYGVRLWDNRRT